MNTAELAVEMAERALRARRLNDAPAMFERAERSGADVNRCAAGRWMVHMLQGEFEQAWRESDGIRARGSFDPHRMWQGEPLAGKRVMVRCLHGFGDAVQFLRYIPRLRQIAADVIIEVAPTFVELARCFDGVGEVVTWGEGAPAQEPRWDAQIEIMELPYFFRTHVGELPIARSYLRLPLYARAENMKCGECYQVGLAWTAGEWNTARSVPLSMLKPLLEVSGCEFWNLQGCESRPDHEALIEDDICRDSIVGLAATISRLDLVITVDTLAAHLAGALGVPAWVMLQHEADWRWMHGRSDSPWYPSLRLIRQREAGDWSSVIETVSEALRQRVRAFSEQRRMA